MRIFIGILGVLVFIPLSISYAGVLVAELNRINWLVGQMRWLAGGFVAYGAVHLLFARPIALHIFEHELTHALWSVVTGGKLHSIYISRTRGGYMSSSSTNFLVLLAPYFFPLYALIFLGIYLVASPGFQPYLLFCIGFTFAFHLVLTVYSLLEGQSDIRKVGLFFSITLIIFMNILIGGLIVSAVSPDLQSKYFLLGGVVKFRDIFTGLFDAAGIK